MLEIFCFSMGKAISLHECPVIVSWVSDKLSPHNKDCSKETHSQKKHTSIHTITGNRVCNYQRKQNKSGIACKTCCLFYFSL